MKSRFLLARAKYENQDKSAILRDVVVLESAVILEMFSSVHETRLARGFEVWWMCLNVQDLGFDVLDGVVGLDLDSDHPAAHRLGKHPHSTKSEHQVKSALLLDVIVGETAAILELFSSENETLLIWGNSLLVLEKKKLKSYPK